jgi:hypothetical protein
MLPLLEQIETFIGAHDLSERRFGELALKDKNLISDLRGGRSPSLNTVERLQRFMATYPNHDRAAV